MGIKPNQRKGKMNMGFNTTILVLNDHLNEIEKDKHFGKKLADLINSSSFNPIPTNEQLGYAKFIESHHSSEHAVVEIGGNGGETLFHDVGYHEPSKDKKLNIVKRMAKLLGYRLVKIR